MVERQIGTKETSRLPGEGVGGSGAGQGLVWKMLQAWSFKMSFLAVCAHFFFTKLKNKVFSITIN